MKSLHEFSTSDHHEATDTYTTTEVMVSTQGDMIDIATKTTVHIGDIGNPQRVFERLSLPASAAKQFLVAIQNTVNVISERG